MSIKEDVLKTKVYWNELEARNELPSIEAFLP
jgi:putative two-component system response regulator